MSNPAEKRDLSLVPGTYAFIQDGSKGTIKVCTGPTVMTPSAQDKPVIFDEKKRTFVPASLEESVRKSIVTVEGYYVELLNPAKDGSHPSDGQIQNGIDLLVGRKINVPGPLMFALWPGQMATIIRGHYLRSNQYLLCRVYNEDEARKNWEKAVIKKASIPQLSENPTEDEKKAYDAAVAAEKKSSFELPKSSLSDGKLFIIRGTEVSFYIPPTGVTVVPEVKSDGESVYARDALTLERLEYAILVDENGRKRYENGPAVVFPSPTEKFLQDKDEGKKFKAIELNEIQGLHVKVIADYEENGQKYKAGQELFITGKDTAIYYPREEHSAVKYDGKTKHFATAVPAGEARYVMNRITGDIKTVHGPAMLLPDPRTEIIVRRVLSDLQCERWYPGNQEVLKYNQSIRALMENAPTTRTGTVSEGEIERAAKSLELGNKGTVRSRALSNAPAIMYASSTVMDSSQVSREQNYVGDEFSRQSTYTQPRTLTLNSKYQGVPTIELWTNYGVMVVSKTGERRVEVGPTTIPLAYDESLEVLEFSTGKPKNTDKLQKTVYLRVKNNKVADIIYAETVDHVKVELSLSYVVDFEGDKEKWFAVENYVKFLCDHARSVLKGAVRKIRIEDFYKESTDIIRNILLGAEKKGMFFEQNNMRMSDVEVLGVTIRDERIRNLLETAQISTVQSNIEVSTLERDLFVTSKKEEIARAKEEAKKETRLFSDRVSAEIQASQMTLALSSFGNELKKIEELKKIATEQQASEKQATEARLELEKMGNDAEFGNRFRNQDLRLKELEAETKAAVERLAAAKEGFSEALLALSNNETMAKVAEAWNIQRAIGGDSLSDAISKAFAGTSLEHLAKRITNGHTIVDAKKDSAQPRV